MARGYRMVRLVTRNGETIEGLLKAEDAFSMQILDRDQRLRGFRVADLASLERLPHSLMPAFDSARLDETRLNDLLVFLVSALNDTTAPGTTP